MGAIHQAFMSHYVASGATYYATDNFNRADSGSLGANWTDYWGGTVQITSNAVWSTLQDSFGVTYYNAAQAATANYSVEGTIYAAAATGATTNGLAGRINTSNQQCYLVFWNSGGYWDLSRFDSGGNPTNLATAATPIPTTTRTVELKMNGTTISVLVDGSQVMSVTDSTYSAIGYGGLTSWYSGTGGGSKIDDFSIHS